MRIISNIDTTVLGRDPQAIATIARGFLQGVIAYDRILRRKGLVPSLYDAGERGLVQFRREPWAGKFDEFADAYTALKRGWLDCEDAVAWRIADLQEAGKDASVKIYWRRNRSGDATIYHAQVRLPDGSVEDPARLLGMGARGE